MIAVAVFVASGWPRQLKSAPIQDSPAADATKAFEDKNVSLLGPPVVVVYDFLSRNQSSPYRIRLAAWSDGTVVVTDDWMLDVPIMSCGVCDPKDVQAAITSCINAGFGDDVLRQDVPVDASHRLIMVRSPDTCMCLRWVVPHNIDDLLTAEIESAQSLFAKRWRKYETFVSGTRPRLMVQQQDWHRTTTQVMALVGKMAGEQKH